MKTKISHFGRSSVSVILAVMMLLSTMLVGTVSTVNAIGADNNNIVSKGETLYLNLKSQPDATTAEFLVKDCLEGESYFSKLPDDKIVSVTLSQNVDFSTYTGRLYAYNGNNRDNDQNNLPKAGQNMVVVEENGTSYHWAAYTPVADKVLLTASDDSVKVNTAVTLTATLDTLATGLDPSAVTYTFKRTNGDEVTGGTTEENTYKFTPTTPGEYKFEVTASAEGHSPVKAETTVNVSAETKNVTFSITGGSGTVKLNDATVNNSDEIPVELNSSYTITVTPDADSYIKTFKVDGKAVEGNTYTANISADVAVVVEFAKKTLYSVTAGTIDGGSVAIDHTNAYEGQKVTVTPTATTEGYTLGTITAKCGKEDVALTRNSDGTYTFSMPAGDVTIDATFRAKKDCTVKVSSENLDLGTVTLGNSSDTLETTVKEGDTVTIAATPSGSNIFKSWSINGTYDIQDSKTTSDAAITLVVNSDITATASFTQAAPYQVAYGSKGTLMRMNKTKYDGVYISTGTIVYSTDGKDQNSHFTIYDTANNRYAFSEGKDTYWINGTNPTPSIVKWVDSYASARKALNNYKTAKYVIFDSFNNFIALSDTPEYSPKLTLYVKPGTVSYDKSSGTDNSKYASSSVAKGLDTTTTTPCNTYTVSDGDNITITTKMSEVYKNLGYYVAAYCVNGVNYNASLSAEADTYQANITVSTDMAVKNSIEVTPIYYNKTIEANGDYITFYVNADEALKSWGNTLSVDPYCYSTTDGIVHFFEKYPGQPLVKDGQYYVTKISKYYYKNNNGTLEKTTDTVSGITLNNYYNDSVHVNLSPSGRNMQTYDFSDFVKLSDMEDVKTIMFQNKFYNADSTDAVKNIEYAFKDGTAVEKLDNIADADTSKKVNTWQNFTDYYGRDTDVLGNILSGTDKNKPCLYIISTGFHDTRSQTHAATKGEWATKWCVYDNDGNLITCGTPADFLDTNSEQYTALNNEKYLNKPVKISYEKGTKFSNGYSRSDGRWYYSALGQEFTSDVAIEYKGDDGTYKLDTNTNTANTGFIGKTSGATATINNVTTASFTSVTDTAHLNIKVANGWRFDGWYINGNKIGDNYTDISTDILMSNSYNVVARVSQIPSGTLELNHMAYTGTDPAAHTGTGFYYISAVLKKANGTEQNFAETQGVIQIPNFAEDDELTITLRAKCHGDNTVYALYEGEPGGYTETGPDTNLRGLSEFTYTFTTKAGSLFKNGQLAVNALNYYTDIVKVGGTCDITYKYFDRFSVEGEGKMVSYVVKNVELSTQEILDNYKPSDSTITKYAPRIDTMYVDTKWNLDDTGKVEKGRSQATVIATQTKKKCRVYHPVLGEDGYYTEIADSTPYTVDYNSLLINPDDSFMLSAPEKTADGAKAFSYWNVYKADENGDKTGELVTKCYERNFGLRIMADYYIEPVYGKEVPPLTANINSPVMNREVYGDSASAIDKVYVDLLTAFTSTAIPTFKENTTNLNVECGVFVVRNNTNKLTEEERNQLVDAANNDDADTTSTILANHHIKNEEALHTELDALVKNDKVKNNANSFYDIDGENVRVTKYVFNNDALTNKNRIDKVIKYTNNTANQNYIFSAYAYVIIRNADGSVNNFVISDPQYYNICYVGNKA